MEVEKSLASGDLHFEGEAIEFGLMFRMRGVRNLDLPVKTF